MIFDRFIKIGNLTIGKGNKIVFDTLSGIGTGNVRRSENEYVDTDGIEIDDVLYNARTIEITGTVMADSYEEFDDLKRQLIQACNPKGSTELTYFDGMNFYYAKAVGDSLPEFGKRITRNCWWFPFTAYLILPNFYWQSELEYEQGLHQVIGNLTKYSDLPCKFSTRISECDIENSGDVATEPLIKVYSFGDSALGSFKVTNQTTGKHIELDYQPKQGEWLTIDMQGKKIYSDRSGNIIKFISSDSDFFGFELGVNHIRCNADNVYAFALYRYNFIGV